MADVWSVAERVAVEKRSRATARAETTAGERDLERAVAWKPRMAQMPSGSRLDADLRRSSTRCRP